MAAVMVTQSANSKLITEAQMTDIDITIRLSGVGSLRANFLRAHRSSRLQATISNLTGLDVRAYSWTIIIYYGEIGQKRVCAHS